MARPTDFTPEVAGRILAAILEGNFEHAAATAGGISPSTLRAWKRRGKAGEEPFASFYREFMAAIGAAETSLVAIVRTAAKLDARHAEWLLARRYPDVWSVDRREMRELKKAILELQAKVAESAARRPGPTPPTSLRPKSY